MNERTDRKFIFVTQFLSEVARIMEHCASRGFVTPDSDLKEGKTKLSDMLTLLENGQNIATTHALFVCCTEDVKHLIRDQRYVLVLDETVDVMRMSEFKSCDIDMLTRANIVEEDDGLIKWIDEEYEQKNKKGDGMFSDAVRLSKSKNLLSHDDRFFYWALPPELFDCFEEVYVLTYMFHAQLLRCFFEMHHFPYEYVGVRPRDGSYEFCAPEEMDRRRDLRDKVHILSHKKLNEVGAKRNDLSYSSYEFGSHKLGIMLTDKLRKNLVNVFRNIYHAPSKQIMWTTFKEFRADLSSKGYAGGFVPYNKRASNEYSDRHYLAYCINNFLRPWEMRYYRERGVEVDNDAYGLSFLVQWIFRSAIRNGEEIWIYIPSVRMRTLLIQWLDNLAEGKDLEPISYKTPRKSYYKKVKKKR